MKRPKYDCDPETVLTMQDMGVDVEDILQYCRAILSHAELQSLIRGLEELIGRVEEGTIEECREIERTV